jgi:hypothetical protein
MRVKPAHAAAASEPSARSDGRRAAVLFESSASIAVPALVHAERPGEEERQSERAVERQLARLRPEHVGRGERLVEATVVGLKRRLAEDADGRADPRGGDPLLETIRDGPPRPGDEDETEFSAGERRAQRREQTPSDVRLRARAADGEDDRRHTRCDGPGVAEAIPDLVRVRRAEGAARIEARETRRDGGAEIVTRQLRRQREAGDADEFRRHAVASQARGRRLGGGEVDDVRARRLERRPDAVHVAVGDDEVDALGTVRRRGDRRRVERGDERIAACAQVRREPRAESVADQRVESAHGEGRRGVVASRGEIGDPGDEVEQAARAGRVPGVRGAGEALVQTARAQPEASLVLRGDGRTVGEGHAGAARGRDRCRRAEVSVPHVERGDHGHARGDGGIARGSHALRPV